MQSTSADYKTAIASTDREIRGYLKFNNTFTLRGSDGLVSFKTTQNAMDAERYCAGSTTSCFCEASFYNSGLDGSGVSLANSYFDAYVGVCTAELPDADKDYVEETLAIKINYIFNSMTYIPLGSTVKPKLEALNDGDEIVFNIEDVDYVGTWDATLHKASVTDGTLTYTLFYDGYALAKLSINDANDDPVYGTYKIGLTARVYKVEYVCCGRYYISEITRGTATTRIVGYDIAGRLSMDYVPTVTPDPDNGYLVMDILNDIIDQTGVNGGTHFTTYGDSTYVAQIFEGNCRAQWGWLCSLVSAKAASYSGTRDPADLGYMKEYYAGNGEANPYAVDETTTYLDGVSFGDEYTIASFTTGTTEAPIVIGNGTGVYGLNPYMDNATATTIEGTVDNYKYYPATLHWRGDPALDIFDEINVTQGADTYKLIAMKIETTFNGGLEQTINCYGDSENYYALSTSPTQGQINRVNNLVQEIQQAIETADGGVITKILDTDGTWKELVIANNQDLDQATSVWRFNINGLAHSDRYQGGTYTLAMDTQGRIVANVIQTGILQDAQGDNSWNLDTGAFSITNGSVNITTNSQTYDAIRLNYQGWHNSISPLELKAVNDGTERAVRVQAGGIYFYTGYGTASEKQTALWTGSSYYSYNGLIKLYDTNDDERVAAYGSTGGIWLKKATDANTSLFITDTSDVTRTRLSSDALTFFDANGAQTAVYPADPSSLLKDNEIAANGLYGSGYNLYSSTGTTTIALTNDKTYLVTLTRRNSTDGSYNAMWLVSAGTNNSNVTTIKSGTGSSASVNGLTLSITRGTAYSRVTWLRLN